LHPIVFLFQLVLLRAKGKLVIFLKIYLKKWNKRRIILEWVHWTKLIVHFPPRIHHGYPLNLQPTQVAKFWSKWGDCKIGKIWREAKEKARAHLFAPKVSRVDPISYLQF
jgi:hypothetical protein